MGRVLGATLALQASAYPVACAGGGVIALQRSSPSRTQIEEVQVVLLNRGDVDRLAELSKLCMNYIYYS
jgi:hypothetical protein